MLPYKLFSISQLGLVWFEEEGKSRKHAKSEPTLHFSTFWQKTVGESEGCHVRELANATFTIFA